jgi:glycosyltransferase involved in cell wall biosynthesis
MNNDVHFDITVVDDGSLDSSVLLIQKMYGDRIKLIEHEKNYGRSTARNNGANKSEADYIIFIDSDCIPAKPNFINAYAEEIKNNYDLLFGLVDVKGEKFWDKLQRLSFEDRLKNFNNGQEWVYTTQNVCIKKSLFIESGGFSQIFDKNGFEDRDLFIRLIDNGAKCCFVEKAKVWHQDEITLKSVSTKLLGSGRYSSFIFNSIHPSAYRSMLYSKIDCQIKPWLAIIDFFTWPIIKIILTKKNSWLEFNIIPFKVRAFMARAIYSLCYLHGTRLALSEKTQPKNSMP